MKLPCPVEGLRKWNDKLKKYEKIDEFLDGAPRTQDEKNKIWNQMLQVFYKKYGKNVIQEWLNQYM